MSFRAIIKRSQNQIEMGLCLDYDDMQSFEVHPRQAKNLENQILKDMIHCIECEVIDDYPCEQYGACPNDDDFQAKAIEHFKREQQ